LDNRSKQLWSEYLLYVPRTRTDQHPILALGFFYGESMLGDSPIMSLPIELATFAMSDETLVQGSSLKPVETGVLSPFQWTWADLADLIEV
jgi:hypothetical protein